MPTTVEAVTADVVIANAADVAPPATDTLAGTPTTLGLALESATDAPAPGAAALSDTVPVEGWPPCTLDGLTPTDATAGATVPAPGFQPSWTTSKSPAVRAAKAGLRMSLFQRVSKVPPMYMSEPLSATMRPCVFMARKIFCTSGVKPEMSFPAFSRSRAPMGSAPWVLPAVCDAGYTWPFV